MPFLILFFMGYPGLSIALLLFLFPVLQLALSFQSNKVNLSYQAESEYPKCKPSSRMFSSCLNYRTFSGYAPFLLIIQLLLHLAGDLHPNPAPKNTNKTNQLSVIHVNVRSLKNKIDILACDMENNDIVTIFET